MASFRLPERMWRRFGEAATAAGTTRTDVLRAFVAWYIREHGAKPVERPPGGSRI